MTMNDMKTYENGGCKVVIKEDGSKTRFEDGPPILPESIDIKITDHCDAGCKFCHEMSTKKGKHGDKEFIYKIIEQMIPGTEAAIGGGDPLSHPYINDIINKCNMCGVIPNLTVNQSHLSKIPSDLNIKGLGISIINSENIAHDLNKLNSRYKHIVFHLINKIHSNTDILNICKCVNSPKILILGFKDFGFGKTYICKNEPFKFDDFSDHDDINIAFDNLGVSQIYPLLPKLMPEKYMGNDGQYTMYIDAVKQEYAVSSTSPRFKYDGDLSYAFHKVRMVSTSE